LKLVANSINGILFSSVFPTGDSLGDVDEVLASVAYGSTISNPNGGLITHCIDNKFKLEIWMRYDETVPISIPLLELLLRSQSNNVFTRFVPDRFHAKVVYWRGYGAYIGSANHTEMGWNTNIEMGVFLSEDELVSNEMDLQLSRYFDFLADLDSTIQISEQYIEEMKELQDAAHDPYKPAKLKRRTPEWGGPSFVSSTNAEAKAKERFKSEWHETLTTLKNIESKVENYRPAWIDKPTPAAWQVDQLLHAYYYIRVGDSRHKPFEEYFQRNRKDPNGTLKEQLEWWASQPAAPFNEDENLFDRAPVIREYCQEDKIRTLTPSELELIFSYTHATSDHIIKIPTSVLGRPELKSIDRATRTQLFTEFILNQRNKQGWDIRELLHYVLYGGDEHTLWQRLYLTSRNPDYTIPRYGINSIAEVVGWARPEIAPPRNGRTSKSLRALGFPVKIY
jgi:hypothetical protein